MPRKMPVCLRELSNPMKEFVYPLRIHIEDTDCTGIVYHAKYLHFMERARSEWIDSLGMGMDWQRNHELIFVVHSASIRFLKPARVHDRVEVVSVIKSLRPASIIFDQCLRSADMPDKILCKAEVKVACVDKDMQPSALPASTIIERIGRVKT